MAEKSTGGAKPPRKENELLAALRAAGTAVGEKLTGKPAQSKLPNRIKLLISIVNERDGRRLKEVLDDCSVALTFSFAGMGTAHSQILDYLGIGETEKAVLFSLIPESDECAILREIRNKMALYLVGRGISFTVPLTGISEIAANGIANAATNKGVDKNKIMTNETRKFDLIVAAVAAGFAEEAMQAARTVGAAGGTIVHARTMNNAKAEQFIGVSLTQEQEILLILTKRDGKLAIMQALSEKVGLKTPAGGMIFSLPVDRTAGISAADEAEQDETKNEAAKETTQKTE